MGFKRCSKETSVYRKEEERTLLIVAIYVDDLFVTGNTLKVISEFKAGMSTKFEMSDLGRLTYLSRYMQSPRKSHGEIMKHILRYLKGTITGWKTEHIIIKIDNKSAIALTKNPYFMVKANTFINATILYESALRWNLFDVEHVPGVEQKADILTKALAKIKFAEMRSLIGVQDMTEAKLKLKRENVLDKLQHYGEPKISYTRVVRIR
ncbi:hypothetical protein D5086_004260 [Populus alba]|uniref:Uncharacterized protein n=1 Tax=Populus alba TaxID=43335 RepID=A0ACC4CR26_POPAL